MIKKNNEMRNAFATILVTLALVLVVTPDAFGQRKKKKSSSREKTEQNFGQNLWYGGGFTLGFSSGNSFITGDRISSFQFGISPMVGYKFNEFLSAGPRVALQYNFFRTRVGNGQIENAQPLSYAVGVFMRGRVSRNLFAQVEYEIENEAFIQIGFDDLEVFRRENNNFYIGGGYNSGDGLFGYEIAVLYNVNEPQNSIDTPLVIRAGFTYNF